MNPYVVAGTYAVVGTAFIPLGLELFSTKYRFADVLLATITGALLSLVPTVGDATSLIATLGILYWRVGKDAFVPDILVSVFAARIVMFLALFRFAHS